MRKKTCDPRRGPQAFILLVVRAYSVQPGWLVHSTELNVEHWAAVPPQAFQVQPDSLEQARAPVFDSQAAAVPAHELPFQLQPAD